MINKDAIAMPPPTRVLLCCVSAPSYFHVSTCMLLCVRGFVRVEKAIKHIPDPNMVEMFRAALLPPRTIICSFSLAIAGYPIAFCLADDTHRTVSNERR